MSACISSEDILAEIILLEMKKDENMKDVYTRSPSDVNRIKSPSFKVRSNFQSPVMDRNVNSRLRWNDVANFETLAPKASAFERKFRKHKNETIDELFDWLNSNRHNPYPSMEKRREFCKKHNLTLTQINDWFSNARRRYLNDRRARKSAK